MTLSLGEGHTISFKRFLLLTDCPPAWYGCNLYLFRDDVTVFYVGQSGNVYERVWEHILGGFKGRSAVGRFILCNWPHALNFYVQLLCSGAACFQPVGHTLDAAERYLIEALRPCFNAALNHDPTPLPSMYQPPGARVPRPRGLKRMIYDAERAVAHEEGRRGWGPAR